MKTTMSLLMMTDGRPVMRVKELAELLDITPRTVHNKIAAGTLPIKTFKLGSDPVAHVADVAAYIDAQRAAATAM
jgi:predicted DNA-binding transcriptional regulator AlpA